MAGMFCAFCMCLVIAQQPVGNVTGAYFSPGSDHIACVWRAGDGQSVVSIHDTSTGEQVGLVPLRSGLEWVGWCDDESFACQDAARGVDGPRRVVRFDSAGTVTAERALPLPPASRTGPTTSFEAAGQDLQGVYCTARSTHTLEASDAWLLPVAGSDGELVLCQTVARRTQVELTTIGLRSLPIDEARRLYLEASRKASAAGWAEMGLVVFGGPGDGARAPTAQEAEAAWRRAYDRAFGDAMREAFAGNLLWVRTDQEPAQRRVRTALHRWSWSMGADASPLLSRQDVGLVEAVHSLPGGGSYAADFTGGAGADAGTHGVEGPHCVVWTAREGEPSEVLMERSNAHVVAWLSESELLVREGGWDRSRDATAKVVSLRAGQRSGAISSATLYSMQVARILAEGGAIAYPNAAHDLCVLVPGNPTPTVVARNGEWDRILDVASGGSLVAYMGADSVVQVWAVGGDLTEVLPRGTLPEGPGAEPGGDGPGGAAETAAQTVASESAAAGANAGEAGPRLALLCESGAGVFYCEWQPTAGTAPSPPSASPVTVGEPVVYWQTLPDGAGAIAVLGAPTASDELGGIGTRVLACRSGGSSNVMQVSAPGVLDGACSVVCPSRDGKRAVVVVKQGRRSDIGILPLDLDAMAFGAGAQHGMLELDLLTYIDDGVVMDGAWSPGSDGIALLVVAAGDDGRPRVSLGAVRVDGAWGDGIVVAPELGLILLPRNNRAWSPSGEHLVFGGRERDAQGQDGLAPPESTRAYIWDTGTQATKPLTPEGWWAWPCAWSPDGREVLCARREAGARSAAGHAAEETELWAVATESGEARRIATVPHAVVGAEWSPDGMYIAALQYAEAGHAHLTLVAPDGALSDVPLPDGMAVVDAAWCR